MSIRYSTSLLGLCLATAAAGLLSPVAAQRWVMPRTPDGHPDLQGNWNNETLTPFQRARDQGPVLTSDEVERIEGRRLAQVIDGAQASDPNRGPAPVTGQIGRSYNEIYYNRGDRVAIVNGEPRSSLITNPPDGRRPPLTSEAQRLRQERRDFRSQFGGADHPELRSLSDRFL